MVLEMRKAVKKYGPTRKYLKMGNMKGMEKGGG